ncbi:MAG TPA: Nramp family divalent metal transporter [Sedimentisphaerales bacterium]|nr:Nramp family divalent metal transporter [Sedimentisphaerales bacterium]HRS11430.1 Nramp family divalent metal transporter [Sedimentisphaerales bacterium]HRV48032.1 Nramp family divalent metal transporter [Sedimentisphaerales bacterium]
MSASVDVAIRKSPWWRSIGPALITACVVFGPGSLVISSNVGATYGYELLWLLALAGLVMGAYMTMSARTGVTAGATHFTTLAREVNRPFAALLGIVLCLTCAAFQFSNNLAIALVAGAFAPQGHTLTVQLAAMGALNLLLCVFLFKATHVFKTIERIMKVMVGIVLVSFLFNLFVAWPDWLGVLKGLVPSVPEKLSLGIPRIIDGAISDPLVLIASLLGTTFSVAGAFFQGNLVREKNWNVEDYYRGIGDSVAGVFVLTLVSAIIMTTAATVIFGRPADNMAALALTLGPLLGPVAFYVFCIGLVPIALNPFLINAMIGGTALADGLGLPGKMSDRWPRILTVGVLLVGFLVAAFGLWTRTAPVNLMIAGQAMTVIGNPLMAGTLLWLANRRNVMGERRNRAFTNLIGVVGFLIVLLLSVRMVWFLYLRISLLLGA